MRARVLFGLAMVVLARPLFADVFADADRGDLAAVRAYAEGHGNMAAVDASGGNLLHHAAATSNRELVEFLIAQGVSVRAARQDGCTPLHVAAENGEVEVTRTLLAHGADPEALDARRRTPLAAGRDGGWGCMSPLSKLLKGAVAVAPLPPAPTPQPAAPSAPSPRPASSPASPLHLGPQGDAGRVSQRVGKLTVLTVTVTRIADGLSVRTVASNDTQNPATVRFCVRLLRGGKKVADVEVSDPPIAPGKSRTLLRSADVPAGSDPDAILLGPVGMPDMPEPTPAAPAEPPAATPAAAPKPVVAVAPKPARGWPQWRGPLRNGQAVDSPPLADRWSGSGPRRVWAMHDIRMAPIQYMGGAGSPIVADGRVYVYAHDKGKREDVFAAVDCATGRKLWERRLPGVDVIHGSGCTPCIAGNRLYGMTGRVMYCLDADTGAVVWKLDSGVPTTSRGVWMWNQEVSTSVAVVGDIAMVCLGPLHGLDCATGTPKWHAPRPGGWADVMSSVGLWQAAGGTYAVYGGWEYLCCADAATGAPVWTKKSGGGGECNAQTPAIDGDLMVTHFDGQLRAYRLAMDGPKELWHGRMDDLYASPAIWAGFSYTVGDHGSSSGKTLRCVEIATGRIAWDAEVPSPEYSSPIVADGKVILLAEKGRKLMAFDARSGTGRLIGSVEVNALMWTSPAFADGRVYVRLADGLACYDLTSGSGG